MFVKLIIQSKNVDQTALLVVLNGHVSLEWDGYGNCLTSERAKKKKGTAELSRFQQLFFPLTKKKYFY